MCITSFQSSHALFPSIQILKKEKVKLLNEFNFQKTTCSVEQKVKEGNIKLKGNLLDISSD